MNKLVIALLMSVLFGCSGRVVITRDYVSCTEWGKDNHSMYAPGFSFKKISFDIPTQDVKNIDIKSLVDKHKVDSSFCYTTGYISDWKIKRVYFNNSDSSFKWRKECHINMNTYADSLGPLDLDSWYLFEGVKKDCAHYVYVDMKGKTRVFEVGVYKGPW